MKLCYHWLSRRRFAKRTLPLVVGIKRVLTPPSCNQPQGSSGHSSKSGVGIHFISSFEQRRPGLKDYSKILPHKQPACRLTLPRRSQSTKHTQLIPRLIITTLPSNRCFTHTKTILRQRSTDHITRAGRLKGIASQACSGAKHWTTALRYHAGRA